MPPFIQPTCCERVVDGVFGSKAVPRERDEGAAVLDGDHHEALRRLHQCA